MSKKTNHLYDFGDFMLDTNERVLYKNERLVTLAPKVFDTLLMLVESNGKILTKDELMDSIWKDSFVEESNLTQNIYNLRQLFGKKNKFITTIPRRGYRFDAEIKMVEQEASLVLGNSGSIGGTQNPADISEVVIAKKTTTTLVAEEIIEEDQSNGLQNGDQAKLLPSSTLPNPIIKSRRFSAGLTAGIFAALVASAFGFYIWQKNFSNPSSSLLEKVSFTNLTDTGDVQSFAVSPDGKFLALLRNDLKYGSSIWLKDIDSKEALLLNISKDFKPRALDFSPDGNSIYFLNRRDSVKGAEIHKTSRFGGDTEYICGDVWSDFSVSPSGKKIAFFREKSSVNQFQVIIRNLEKQTDRVLVTKDFPDGFYRKSSPVWSPDEKDIYAILQSQSRAISSLVKIPVESGEESVIKIPKIRQFVSIVALPNNEEIIFVARERKKFPQIYKISKLGGEMKRLTNDLNVYRKLVLSLDGKTLVALQKVTASHIWLLPDSDPDRAIQLTEGNYNRDGKHGIDVLPNGKVVFTSLEDMNRDIWIVDPKDKSKKQLTKNLAEINERPSGSNGAKYIYFSSLEKKTFRIKRIEVERQIIENITTNPSVNDLFPNVSPDRETLYFIRKAKGKTSIIRKVLADGAETEIRIPKDFAPDSFLALSPDGRFLAFRNADRAKKNKIEENASNPVKIGIVAIDGDLSKAKMINVTTSQSQFRWNTDGNAITFIQHTPNSSTIRQENLNGDSEPEVLVEIPDSKIYHFQWMNGKDLVVARGQTRDDAVLIRRF